MERRIEFDIMKGIGILLVMLGHTHMFHADCVLPSTLSYIIGSFHVPLFFIVAGYFSKTNTDNALNTVSRYFKRLGIPYFVSAFVIIAYNAILAYKRHELGLFTGILGSYLWADTSGIISSSFGFPEDMGVGPVWFLLALFWAKSLFLLISKSGKYTYLICFLLSWGFSCFEIPMPFMLRQGITALGFVALGHWWKNCSLPKWFVFFSVVCWIIEVRFQIGISPYSAHYSFYPINLLGAFGATYIIYLCSLGLCKIKYLNSVVALIGNNSMNVLCAHTIDMRCNAIRLILKQVPIINSVPWLFVGMDYLIVLLLSFVPCIRQKKE